MKICFLDIDNVITISKSNNCLCPIKISLLEEIVYSTNCKIVISSSWRRHTLEDTLKYITNPNNKCVGNNPFTIPEHIVGITSRMYAFKHGEKNKHYRISRGEEIERYMEEHQEITNYVILDDAYDMLLCQKDNFVHVDDNYGLSKKDVENAIEILNRKL